MAGKKQPRFLITNDDGIYAPGIWVLAENLKQVGKVVIVAPDREQSAIGTAITLHQPLRLKEIEPLVKGVKAYSVEGTPSDSIILALQLLLRNKVDMVFSGINEGANLGDDVLLSGTVGGAMQGYLHGLPAVAISVNAWENVHFEAAAILGVILARKLLSSPPSVNIAKKRILLNVNLPNLPVGGIRGIEITHLAGRSYFDLIKKGHDGKRDYYWIVRGTPLWEVEEGTDAKVVQDGRISITPIHSDLSLRENNELLYSVSSEIFRELRDAGR